ncbi:hypothetical protein DEJ46_33530 [Streptomyces venezuelae]|uniref:Uncharacterized protein n=1 Tax=Streptomyces venezuelae TaxID=54571 RepID=A0A5P2AYR8_STRVZ|nr:hypothetical protein DEJ46_33530 [Streptomyces venezuelae]
MGGMQDKRQEPGKGREEQERQIHDQDPAHPEPSAPSRGKQPEPVRRKGSRKSDRARERDEGL